MTYNWEQVRELIPELVGQCDKWQDLADKLAGRVGKMPRRTLTDWLGREWDTPFSSFADFKAKTLGEEDALSPLAQALLGQLRKEGSRDRPQALTDLSEQMDRSMGNILSAAEELHGAGYMVDVTDDREVLMPSVQAPTRGSYPMDMYKRANAFRFGVLSDTHLCNRNARLDVLETAYDFYEEEGIEVVLHAGNIVDGEFKWNRSELAAHGVEGQIRYCARQYPQRDNIVTKFITGECHEGWWGKELGWDVGRYMMYSFQDQGRGDLEWVGHIEHDLALDKENKRAVLRIMHPGGGTAYATSYSVQKHVEAWQGGEKPSVAIFGHYHKYGAFYPREVFSLMPGCVCDQTIFMRKGKMPAHVGFCILEIHMTSLGGVARVKHEFMPYYDKGYYQSWDYRSLFETL